MGKAVLFIAMEGLFMCSRAWVDVPLTFSISLPLLQSVHDYIEKWPRKKMRGWSPEAVCASVAPLLLGQDEAAGLAAHSCRAPLIPTKWRTSASEKVWKSSWRCGIRKLPVISAVDLKFWKLPESEMVTLVTYSCECNWICWSIFEFFCL